PSTAVGAWRKRHAWQQKSRRNGGLGASAGSALRLTALADGGNDRAELLVADGARHDLVAHDIARRAVDPERVGQLVALDQRRLDLLALEIALELRHVRTRRLRGFPCLGAVRLAARCEQPLVEVEILLAVLVLH